MFGNRISLNPGRFSKKEHMLITIMASIGYNTPYTDNISMFILSTETWHATTDRDLVWTQYLPQYFNQRYAGSFGYQICIALGTNFIGYGIAGICRRFFVYPTYCVWPKSLVTIALNSSFHEETNTPALGPFKRIFNMSRLRFFVLAFCSMFIYFWFPNFLFGALSIFSWMSWISPDNITLNTITGMNNGLGLNPWPTFDWNILLFDMTDPLMLPFFSTLGKFLGMFFAMFVILGFWYTNTWHTGYLPINSNRVYDHFGKAFNVSRAIDDRGLFDADKYEAYSPAFLAAGNLVVYLAFFAIYAATVSYAFLYHRHEIMMGLKNIFKRNKKGEEEYKDVHNKLMARYPEVSEVWYLTCLAISIAFAVAGIAGWETYVSMRLGPSCCTKTDHPLTDKRGRRLLRYRSLSDFCCPCRHHRRDDGH